MKKQKIIIVCLSIFFASYLSQACDFRVNFCYNAYVVNDERVVVGTISNSMPNRVELDIISVLYGTENNSRITIWDGANIDCNGPHPNNANDLGSIGDTVLCMIEPIKIKENLWDVIGEYRRPSLLPGVASFTNFSTGMLFPTGYIFEETYTFDEVLTLDIADYCCSYFNLIPEITKSRISSLPYSTSSSLPINLNVFPEGGAFSGPGVIFNSFNPTLAGAGKHTITYTFTDEFGCTFSKQDDILVVDLVFNFVNYNLGTISPKIENEINVALEVLEPDQYTFQVFDLNGQPHYRKTIELYAGNHLQNIRFNQNLPKGVYLFSVSNSQTQSTQKMVVSN